MRLMYLQVKKPQHGKIKLFTEKQATTKVPVIFSNHQMLKEMQWRWFLEAVNKEQRYSVLI